MHKDFVPPVSIEEFAAYLDGNLTEERKNVVDALVSINPDMEEMVTISSKIDEDILFYMQDEFAYEADMTALENGDFDIPNIDADITSHTEISDEMEVANVAGEVTDITESIPLNDNGETIEEAFCNDDFQSRLDDGPISISNHDNGDNVQDSSIFPFDENFE